METTERPRLGRRTYVTVLLVAMLSVALLAVSGVEGFAAPVKVEQNETLWTTVRTGDSWFSLRARMFTTDALKRANPGLARNGLQPGDVVRAPYVPAERLEAASGRLGEAERQLKNARGTLAAAEARVASLSALEGRLADERGAAAAMRTLTFALLGVAILLAAGLFAAIYFTQIARRDARLAAARLAKTEESYTELQRSLRTIEIDLQRRMVNLLNLHDVRIVSEEEVDKSLATLLDLSSELKKKHAS